MPAIKLSYFTFILVLLEMCIHSTIKLFYFTFIAVILQLCIALKACILCLLKDYGNFWQMSTYIQLSQ